jgi:hypothetical protein
VLLLMVAFAGVVLAQTAARPGAASVKPAPRTPDGKPNLSGVWGVVDRAPDVDNYAREESVLLEKLYGRLVNEAPSRTPWGQMRFEYNRDPRPGYGGGREELDPSWHCVPYGPSFLVTNGSAEAVGGYEIIQDSRRVLIIYELDHNIRQIWIDGRGHPEDTDYTWMGHSIGKWEGDTLVVDTIKIRNEPWVDGGGNVSSKELRMVERYQRLDHNTLKIELTLHDPKALTKPWTRRLYRRLRNWDLAEDVRCYEGSQELRNQREIFYFEMNQ